MSEILFSKSERLVETDVERVALKTLSLWGFNCETNKDVSTDNPTLLFNISGGVKYEDVLSGDDEPPKQRAQASVQRCIRMDGLDKVGITGRHHIAFDMLGHFNFFEHSEYAGKELAIKSAIDTLSRLGIDDVYATYHPSDEISRILLEEAQIRHVANEKNVHICNQRRRSGTRVELGRKINGIDTELWNIVFTTNEGVAECSKPLDHIAFDSGASIDRLVTAANGSSSDYENESWSRVIRSISSVEPATIAHRIADFTKAAAVLCESGVAPGPRSSSYITRKVCCELIRSEMEYPDISIDDCMGAAIDAHNLQVDLEVAMVMYNAERERVGKLIDRGRKIVLRGIGRHGIALSEPDYNTYKQTYGLDSDMIDYIIADMTKDGIL